MSEILFECYGAPSVAYGVDSLFSYSYNGGRNGLVVDSSYTSTHLIPVVDAKPCFRKPHDSIGAAFSLRSTC